MYLISQGANICLQNHSDGTSLYLDDMILLISFGVFRVRSATIFDEMSLCLYCRFFRHNLHRTWPSCQSQFRPYLLAEVYCVRSDRCRTFRIRFGFTSLVQILKPVFVSPKSTCPVSHIAHATIGDAVTFPCRQMLQISTVP